MSGAVGFKNNVKISERHGAREWTVERIALGLLIPLGVWVASSAFTLTGASHDNVMAWFASPLNAALSALTSVTFFLFAALAWKVIIEDYVPAPGLRKLVIGLINLVFLALAAVSIFLIVRLALGSAPLPAGIGA